MNNYILGDSCADREIPRSYVEIVRDTPSSRDAWRGARSVKLVEPTAGSTSPSEYDAAITAIEPTALDM